jgi:SAM-dependent methyltransferase
LAYSGIDTLELLESAQNYSNFLVKRILELADEHSEVMDFGAGTGHIARRIAGFVNHLVAVEPDSVLQKIASSRGLEVSSFEMLAAERFDVIYSLNVLEHIQNDREAIQALAQKLRTGGVVLLYLPASPFLYSAFDRRIGHFRRYTQRSAVEMFRGSGLQVETIKFHDPLGFVVAAAYRLFSRSGRVGRTSVNLFDRLVFPLSELLEVVTEQHFGKNISIVARKING